MPVSGGDGAEAGRVLQAAPVEALADGLQLGLVEAAARASRVDEPAVPVLGQVEGAEAAAASLGVGVAHHHEVVRAVHPDLDPLRGAPAAVGCVRLLGHETFEAQLLHLGVERLAVLLDVVEVAQGPRLGQDALEQALALPEGQGPQVEVLEAQEVEGVVGGGKEQARALDVGAPLQERPLLQALEAGAPGLVQHHRLAVEDQGGEGEGLERARDLREDGGGVVAPTVDEARLASLEPRHHPVAVVLQLEDPALGGERAVPGLGQGHCHLVGSDRLPGRLELDELRADLLGAPRALAQLLEDQAGIDRLLAQGFARSRVGVGTLDQHPFLAHVASLALDAEEVPGAAQLVAAELEGELAAGERLRRVLQGHPDALVPHDDLARAVVALGDDPLEVGVLDRVVFHLHGHALVGGVEGRPARHRPRAQDPAPLQAEVVVQPGGGVLLHAEEAGAAPGRGGGGRGRGTGRGRRTRGKVGDHTPEGLRGGAGLALGPVGSQAIGCARRGGGGRLCPGLAGGHGVVGRWYTARAQSTPDRLACAKQPERGPR